MKLRSPSLVELHAFLAVYRLGSIRRAADVLCVTQAAVSRAVQRLEQHLGGCRLFDRSPQGVTPTAQGHQLFELTERHVTALEAAAIAFSRPATPARVRLSVIPSLGTQWLMPRLAGFYAAHPGIDIELRQFRHDEDFTRSDVDVWIDVKRPRRRWPTRLHVDYLLGRDVVPVCTPAWRERLREPRDIADAVLLHHTIFPENWARWFDAAGVPGVPRLGPGFDLSINLIVAARSGMGVAIVQPCLIERELREGALVMPFDLPVSTGRGYFVCHDAGTRLSDGQRAFVDWVKREAAA